MSMLQNYAKHIGKERWETLKSSVQEINNTVGNTAVRIILGQDGATVYYGTETLEWPYHYEGVSNPMDTDIIGKAELFLQRDKNTKQWLEAMLNLIKNSQTLDAWPAGKTYTVKAGRIVTEWGDSGRKQKSYACNGIGWQALIDDICGVSHN